MALNVTILDTDSLKIQECLITETDGAGAYSHAFLLPAGSDLVDVQIHLDSLWTAATSATIDFSLPVVSFVLGGLNLKSRADDISLVGTVGASGGGAAFPHFDTETTITVTVTTVGATGHAGRTHVRLVYAVPSTIPNATKV